MSFEVDAADYTAFIGLFSEPLAAGFADLAAVRAGQRALDVGCGPGALTAELVRRLGADQVVAVDPSESFVDAARTRLPATDIRRAAAENLPFDDEVFDVTLAQLVMHFVSEPQRAITELARVTRPGGVVAACVWDHAGQRSPVSLFWRAVRDLDPDARDESELNGARDGHLVELFAAAGLAAVQRELTVYARFAGVEDWWRPYTNGVGPAGDYVATLDAEHRARLLARCRELLPSGAFDLDATAWTALARV